jgi:hypothetical protein
MTSELLAGISGAVLSLLFSYVPGIKAQYDKLTSAQKGLVMLGLLVLVSIGAFGLSCANSPLISGVTCDEQGAWGIVSALLVALTANQATYLMAPQKKSPAVIEAQPEGESKFVDFPVVEDSPVDEAGG